MHWPLLCEWVDGLVYVSSFSFLHCVTAKSGNRTTLEKKRERERNISGHHQYSSLVWGFMSGMFLIKKLSDKGSGETTDDIMPRNRTKLKKRPRVPTPLWPFIQYSPWTQSQRPRDGSVCVCRVVSPAGFCLIMTPHSFFFLSILINGYTHTRKYKNWQWQVNSDHNVNYTVGSPPFL